MYSYEFGKISKYNFLIEHLWWLLLDMCDAKEKGESTNHQFIKERLDSLLKTKTSTGKEIILKADKNLFSIMTIVAQSQQLDMKEMFSHPLGPIQWSLSTADGCSRKTNMAILSKYLEQLSVPAESLPDNVATTIDAISSVQRIKGAQKRCSILLSYHSIQ